LLKKDQYPPTPPQHGSTGTKQKTSTALEQARFFTARPLVFTTQQQNALH
jgi:hypothetical protein